MDHGEAFKLKKLENLRNLSMTKPNIGDYIHKFAKSVLVCCICHSQVVISGFTTSGFAIYKCDENTCPSFGKVRNRIQREWIEHEQKFEYRTVKVL